MRPTRKVALRILLIAFVALAPASLPPAEAGGLPSLAHLWSWLTAWTSGGETAHRITSAFGQSDQGPSIDPLGGEAVSSPTTGQSDQGPHIDPLGGQTLSSTADGHGPGIDPLGGH